jgi:transcriptional antiterminator RfaH
MKNEENRYRWYVVYTHSKQEDRVDQNLKAWNIETFTPKMKVCRRNQFTGTASYITQPLFPRYIFAKFDASSMLHNIRFTRGVNSVVSSGGYLTPIEDEILFLIKSRIGVDGFIRMGNDLASGDKVVITDGPFKDLVGIFERETTDMDRVTILLEVISYQGRITLNRDMVRKFNPLHI